MRLSTLASLATLGFFATVVCAATEGELHPFKRGSWQEIRHAHAGQPIVVHFWGLTCGPCRVEMPRWGRLLQERPDLNLIAIDADLIPNEASLVSEMLVKTGLAGAENWMFADDFVERLRFEINPRWRGEIPMTLLIARDGANACARLGADVVRYSFIVVDLHHLLLAGLPAHPWENSPPMFPPSGQRFNPDVVSRPII